MIGDLNTEQLFNKYVMCITLYIVVIKTCQIKRGSTTISAIVEDIPQLFGRTYQS